MAILKKLLKRKRDNTAQIKKMEARQERKGQKIIGKIDSGKISVDRGNKKLEKLQKRTQRKTERMERKSLPKSERRIVRKMDRDARKWDRQDARAAKKEERKNKRAKKETTRKFLGRKRTVLKSRDAKGDKVKQVIVEKKNKDGTVSYTDKYKRRKKGELLKRKYSKVKGGGVYDKETGYDISYSGTRKRWKGQKDNRKIT